MCTTGLCCVTVKALPSMETLAAAAPIELSQLSRRRAWRGLRGRRSSCTPHCRWRRCCCISPLIRQLETQHLAQNLSPLLGWISRHILSLITFREFVSIILAEILHPRDDTYQQSSGRSWPWPSSPRCRGIRRVSTPPRRSWRRLGLKG